MMGTDDMLLAQRDGGSPMTLAAGSAPGGVSVLSMRFRGSAHFSATTRQHLVWFHSSMQTPFHCRIAGRALRHQPTAGSLAICPAGIDAAAEESALCATLIERLSGYDQALFDLGRELVIECVGHYPSGPLYWNEVASNFIFALVARHTSRPARPTRGSLGKDVLDRLRDYVLSHLDEPIEVATLADIAGRSPFHFTRVFVRCVGLTPHRYIVHLRMRRAIELIRDGRMGLAEIAARTGFADQSHLSRWARRIHGVPLTQLAA